jgi:hypothetical protein
MDLKGASIRRLSAGQIDSALASIATFAAGVYAVSEFDATLLGAYVVTFTAWNVARTLASEMVFVPSEVVAIGRSDGGITVLDSSLWRGTLVSLMGALGVMASIFLILGEVDRSAAIALTVTGAAVTILAPLHEHWRRMFHIADSSWRAAAVSAVHVFVTVVGLLVLPRLVPPAWIPFGVLAVGFFVSTLLAVVLTAAVRPDGANRFGHPSWLELTRIGRWLLVAQVSVVVSDFLLVLIARAIIGGEMVGYAEGARVVARPIQILGLGLAAVLGPRSLRFAIEGDDAKARKTRRTLWTLTSLAAVIYLPLVGFDWALNPLPDLVPTAYEIDGLVAATIIGSTLLNLSLPWWYEALGGRRQFQIAISEVTGSVLKVATGFLAASLQAFVFPIAWAVGWLARGTGLGLISRSVFQPVEQVGDGLPPDSSRESEG